MLEKRDTVRKNNSKGKIMELHNWLWKKHVRATDFAKRLDLTQPALSSIINHARSSRLLTAIKIFALTDGEVSYLDMLSDDDVKELEAWREAGMMPRPVPEPDDDDEDEGDDDRAARDIVRGLDSIERICAAGVAKEGIPEPICPANADVMDKELLNLKQVIDWCYKQKSATPA